MKPDLMLIKGIQEGDMNAFKRFFESFYPSLHYFANKYLHDEEASSDIVQDAFIYLWTKKSDIYSISSAKSYLFKFVKNRSLNYLRDNHTETINIEKVNSETYFRDIIIEEETYRIIYQAIQSLPPQEQHIIELTLDGLKNHEIATQLGISVNTVKTAKLRAYRRLRLELKDQFFTLFMILYANRSISPQAK